MVYQQVFQFLRQISIHGKDILSNLRQPLFHRPPYSLPNADNKRPLFEQYLDDFETQQIDDLQH